MIGLFIIKIIKKMSKHKTYKFEQVPFNLDFKSLPTKRLLAFHRKLDATENKFYNYGYCCEGHCYHYLEKYYRDDNAWPYEKWKKIKDFRKLVQLELNKREHIN